MFARFGDDVGTLFGPISPLKKKSKETGAKQERGGNEVGAKRERNGNETEAKRERRGNEAGAKRERN